MPLHDWTRVEAGIFHGFHVAWCAFLREELNTGLLPAGYYADAEQVMPLVKPSFQRQRRVVVRHVSGDRVVALIEIVSPSNKDRPGSVEDFAAKVAEALWNGVHVLVLDVFPPGPHDPLGMPGAVIEAHREDPPELPPGEPLAFASYRAGEEVKAFVEFRAVGAELPTMPLFLTAERYVDVPLGPSYDRAWTETPARWRDVIAPPG